jgi:hypothetical protein
MFNLPWLPDEAGVAYIARLRKQFPNLAIEVTREADVNFIWDGEGPDPAEEGYLPYDVKVAARVIHAGRIVEGVQYLGGSYFEYDEPTGEIHGYLPQMIDEALDKLRKELRGYVEPKEDREREASGPALP